MATALIAMVNAIATGKVDIMPEVLVTGGGGSPLDGLAATLMRYLNTTSAIDAAPPTPSTDAPAGAVGS